MPDQGNSFKRIRFDDEEDEREEVKRFQNLTYEELEKEYNFKKTLDTGSEKEFIGTNFSYSRLDAKILSYCDHYFWENGSLPTSEDISNELGISLDLIDRKLASRSMFAAMLKMGLPVNSVMTDEGLRASLTPTQLQLANMLMNALDPKSLREKLQMVDVSPQQYERWIRQPAFQSYLRKRAETVFAGADHRAYLKLVEAVDRGDLKAISMFFEMRGIYNPKINVNFSVDGLLQTVLEAVSRHVTPEQLEAIANDLEGISPTPSIGAGNIMEITSGRVGS